MGERLGEASKRSAFMRSFRLDDTPLDVLRGLVSSGHLDGDIGCWVVCV
jgi:hypothetical protein